MLYLYCACSSMKYQATSVRSPESPPQAKTCRPAMFPKLESSLRPVHLSKDTSSARQQICSPSAYRSIQNLIAEQGNSEDMAKTMPRCKMQLRLRLRFQSDCLTLRTSDTAYIRCWFQTIPTFRGITNKFSAEILRSLSVATCHTLDNMSRTLALPPRRIAPQPYT
jgi:hypothetical protein